MLVVPVILLSWLFFSWKGVSGPSFSDTAIIAALAMFLFVVSWLDDLFALSAPVRLLTQFAAVVLASIFVLPDVPLLFGGLIPVFAEKIILAFCWIWFINLFNFMDGIDGISAVELSVVGGGIVIIGLVNPAFGVLMPFAGVMVCAVLGFVLWNWHPARIFLGDVGSAPLGFLCGWLLINLAEKGALWAALILPGYYLADTTFILCKRVMSGEKVWIAHREHCYQRAVIKGMSHAAVSLWVLAVGLILIVVALYSLYSGDALSLAFAAIVIAALMRHFAKT